MAIDQSFAVATHAMSVLAFTDPESISAPFIAEQISVHPVVLRRVLGKMVAAGLVTSQTGSAGGYSLKKRPRQVTLADIYRATHDGDGPFASRNGMPKSNCAEGRRIDKILSATYQQADDALMSSLGRTTLADVVKRAAG